MSSPPPPPPSAAATAAFVPPEEEEHDASTLAAKPKQGTKAKPSTANKPIYYRLEAEMTYDRFDSRHETLQEAAQGAWDFATTGDLPGWVPEAWVPAIWDPTSEEEYDWDSWEPQFIRGFVVAVEQSKKGFYKLTNGASVRGTNYVQITRIDEDNDNEAPKHKRLKKDSTSS